MVQHPNVEAARGALEAFIKGDVEAFAATVADDVVWHAPGSNPFSGDFQGKAETMARMGKLHDAGIQISFDIHDVIGSDDHVAALVEFHLAGPDGRTYDGHQVQVYHVRDGKLSEVWAFNQDQAAFDAIVGG
ncbi:MAG: nuclear transport factor 2 family protein [Actinomycetota bacterium]